MIVSKKRSRRSSRSCPISSIVHWQTALRWQAPNQEVPMDDRLEKEVKEVFPELSDLVDRALADRASVVESDPGGPHG